jgi:hypothetical protein
MTHSQEKIAKKSIRSLLKVLASQYDVLASAQCDEGVLKDYAALLRYLRSARKEDIDRIFSDTPNLLSKLDSEAPRPADADLHNISLEEAEKLAIDETTPRKYLERIAIYRFNIPKGSMRSFSNRQLLVDKLLTVIRNERTHSTIDLVARGQSNSA